MKLVFNLTAILFMTLISATHAMAANESSKSLRVVVALDSASAEQTQQLLAIASEAQDLKDVGQEYREIMADNGLELKEALLENYEDLKEDLKINLELATPLPRNILLKTAVLTYEHVRFFVIEVPLESLGIMIGIGTDIIAPSVAMTLDLVKISGQQLSAIASKTIRYLNEHGYNITNFKRVSYAIRNSSALISHHSKSCGAVFALK